MPAPDLNLIRAFVAVYETGSVTAAAEVLHLSQPSVTHALGRLRRKLNDDLFLRSRSGMTPTAAARRMYPVLVEALNSVEALFASSDNFDPKARTTFRIALSDAGEVSLLPPIAAALHERAPGVTLEIASLDVEIVEGQLMRGELDAFLSSAEFGSRRLYRDVLFHEPYSVLVAESHPRVGATLTSDELDALPHIVVEGTAGHARTAQAQADRHVEVRGCVPHFTALPYLVSQTESVAIVPRFIAEVFSTHFAVRNVDLPWPLSPLEIASYSRHPSSRTTGQAWLLETISETLTQRYGRSDGNRTPTT